MAMDNEDLIRAIETLETAADDGELSEARVQSLDAYRGENTYPAPEGRSQVVDRTLYDVVESIKGPILKLFLAGDEVAKFTPTGPEDIEASEQESAYINRTLNEKNDAFTIFAGWLHDALIQKNGYVIAHWEDEDRTAEERYVGLTDDEFQLLMQSGAEMVEHAESMDMIGQRMHNVVIRRVQTYGCVKIHNVPPESVLVDTHHTKVSLKDANFIARRERKTISELREMGLEVDDEINDGGSSREDWEYDIRRDESYQWDREDTEPDPSMRRVKVREIWMRVDYDGDGLAELRHLIVVGSEILLNESADHVPLVAFSSSPLPHTHYGESVYDQTSEVQDVKTALLRGLLDSLYLANSPRYGVNADRVNLDDMLVSRPGGLVRVDGEPAGAIMPLTLAYNPGPALSALEYMDTVRETRTGITRVGTGLDPNALNKTASGIAMLQGAQSQRIELIARHFAESVKELCLLVHALTLKHSRQQELMMLRNRWVPVDPGSWKTRRDMTISVGLGTGNRQEQSAFLMQMLQLALGPGAQMGLTDPGRIYNMLAKLSNNAGFKAAEEFWVDLSNAPPKPQQPPPPDPKLVEVQQRGQIEQQKLQMSAQQGQQQAQAEMALGQQRAQQQMELERQKAEQDAMLARYKADLDAQVAIEVARIRAQADMVRADTQGAGNGIS